MGVIIDCRGDAEIEEGFFIARTPFGMTGLFCGETQDAGIKPALRGRRNHKERRNHRRGETTGEKKPPESGRSLISFGMIWCFRSG